LIVSFETHELRDCCASLEKAEAVVGSTHAQELISVLADAEAAETAAEFIKLRAPNVAVSDDSISLPMGTRYRLSFVAVGVASVGKHGGRVDWRSVRRLKMMELTPC
jgi:hypothetical protein